MSASGQHPQEPEDTGLEFPLSPEAAEEAEITRIAREIQEADKKSRAPKPEPPKPAPGVKPLNKAQMSPTANSPQGAASDPYFNRHTDTPSSGETPALRPLSQAVISPVAMPPSANDVIMEPQSEDETLNEAILTKRLPKPREVTGRKDTTKKVSIADLESIVAHIPEAGGEDAAIHSVLPQRKVIDEPGLIAAEHDLPRLREKTRTGIMATHLEVLQLRLRDVIAAEGGVPFGLDYYSLHAVGPQASIVENPSLLEASYVGRLLDDPAIIGWACEALLLKCRQNNGKWPTTPADGPTRLAGAGTASALRDVALSFDILRKVLDPADKDAVLKALHVNGLDMFRKLAQMPAEHEMALYDFAPPGLGLAALLLMSEERYYGDAKRWLDFTEQRVQAMIGKRVSESGHPLESDFAGLINLMRYVLPFVEAYKRYYDDDLIMGVGGTLSKLPAWIAHQFGLTRRGLLESGGISLDELKTATPLLAKLADTFRDGVAQWLLQQISLDTATKQARGDSSRNTPVPTMRLELPARQGLDAVLALLFYDPELLPVSPATMLSPGARLSDTRAVVRSNWDEASPIVSLRGKHGSLPTVDVALSGMRVGLAITSRAFAAAGGDDVLGRVRDYIDMGGAAYMNGDFKGIDGSLSQRHLLYLRPENTALLFDRFDMGDGRNMQKFRLSVQGTDKADALDRGTLSVPAADGSGRSARLTFFSNGFSNGVELTSDESQSPGLSVEFARGRGDLATVINVGKQAAMPVVRRLNAKEKGRVYRIGLGEGSVLFNGWPNGMPQQCGWLWTDALLAFVDRTDDYPGRYVAIKATSVLAYDMNEGIYLGFGASHADDPDKPVEFSVCAAGPQAVVELPTRAHLRLSFPGLKSVTVDGTKVELEGEAGIFVISRALEPGRHLIEVDHESPGPQSTVALPAQKQIVGGTFNITGTVGDPIGVDNARLLIDGEYFGATLTQPPWVWPLKTNALAEGVHEAQIEAADVLGHSRRSTVRGFVVDNTAPKVKLIAPKDGKRARGIITLEAEAEDINGIARVQFCLNGRAVGDPVTTPPYARDLDTMALPDGEYSLTALAADAAGNLATSEARKLTLTNKAAPPKIVAIKVNPPMLLIRPLEETTVETIGIDDEDGRNPIRVAWRHVSGHKGVVDRNNKLTAPATEGPCVLECYLPNTDVKAKLHVMVNKELEPPPLKRPE
jgi:hypothetical protein